MINMWDLKNPMGIGFQMGQIWWSHSVRYGMYGSHILDCVLFSAQTKKINILHHIYILQSFWFHFHELQLYKKSKWDPLPSCFQFYYLFWRLNFLFKLVKTVHRQLWSCFIHNIIKGNPTIEYALSQLFIQNNFLTALSRWQTIHWWK